MTDLTYINAALTLCGVAPIGTLEEDVPAAVIANANYEQIVKSELTLHPWRFAAQSQALNRQTGSAPKPWLFAWELPADLLLLRSVTVGDDPNNDEIPYDNSGDKVLCNAEEGVWAHYMIRPPESAWSAAFAEIIKKRMHEAFLQGVLSQYGAAASVAKRAEEYAMRARTLDSGQRSPKRPQRGRLLGSRRAT